MRAGYIVPSFRSVNVDSQWSGFLAWMLWLAYEGIRTVKKTRNKTVGIDMITKIGDEHVGLSGSNVIIWRRLLVTGNRTSNWISPSLMCMCGCAPACWLWSHTTRYSSLSVPKAMVPLQTALDPLQGSMVCPTKVVSNYHVQSISSHQCNT